LKRGSDVLQKYSYGYGEIDGTGNLVTTKNNGQLGRIESYIGTAKQSTQKFLYDHIGRLKESAEYRGDNNNLTYKQKFDFDRFGNLYRKAASNPTAGQQNPLAYTPIEETTTPGTGDIDKQTNRFRTGTTYDDAGQVTTDNKFRTMSFAYDANGRQVKATRASVPDAWTVYDALGNRVATKINDVWQYVIYDAFGKLVAEYGVASEGLGGIKYLQQDWQGSVRTVTNNNGFVVGRTDHQAFGNDVGYGVGQRSVEQGYSVGKVARQGYGLTERDEATGQDHTWFRKNENSAGRWTSPDPYNGSMSLGDPQSFNRYSYVENQPTNFVDPSGLNMVSYFCYDIVTTGHYPNQPNTTYVHTETVCVSFGGGNPTLTGPTGGLDVGGGSGGNENNGETCTLTVNITKAGTSGSSSGSSGKPGAQSGPYNHAYVTLKSSLAAYGTGYRAGPTGVGLPIVSTLEAHSGLNANGFFKDYEENPSGAVVETYNGSCDSLDKAFQDYISKVNEKKIGYSLIGTNSNAFVYSMLTSAGINAKSFTDRLNAALGKTGLLPGWGYTLPVN
jgi:RHS repeat-associated protein